MSTKLSILCVTAWLAAAAVPPLPAERYCWLGRTLPENSLENRIKVPPGFKRVSAAEGEFARWLRGLPLKPGKPDVLLFDGSRKSNQSVHAAVVDIDVGGRDLQQCADAVIRLRAEYLFQRGDFEEIVFHFTDGTPARYTRWAAGYRPRVSSSRVGWLPGTAPDHSYTGFRRYLDAVFTYAGTISLDRELRALRDPNEAAPGDVFIEAGSPGHAVLVVDVAVNAAGRRLLLLAQSYMPAQDIHILINPTNPSISPWYEADMGESLTTPEWVFSRRHLKRF